MHGIQHLFRQHALEKQSSTESWHSAQGAKSSQTSLQQAEYPNKSINLESIDMSFSPGKIFCIFYLNFFSLKANYFLDKKTTSPQPVPGLNSLNSSSGSLPGRSPYDQSSCSSRKSSGPLSRKSSTMERSGSSSNSANLYTVSFFLSTFF